jgi:predicted NAD-dependent protein-ADP-ribosyltransferase YbiA (DUF1768 family)
MVKSQLNTTVNYVERKTIDPEDIGYQSTMYMIDLYDIPRTIVLGKQKYTFSAKDIVFFPIYVIANEKIQAQIGVFEYTLSRFTQLIDSDGDIDIEKMGEPLLYEFATQKYLSGFLENKKTSPISILEKPTKIEDSFSPKTPLSYKQQEEDDDELDALTLKVKRTDLSTEKQKADSMIQKGIFEMDSDFRQPAMLKEEDEGDADQYKVEYKESSRNQWIEKFMKNNHYDLLDNEGRGDCFFAVIRDAFESIGQKTTVSKLRSLLSSHLTDEVFQENRQLYLDFETQKEEIKNKLNELKKANQLYKQRIDRLPEKADRAKLIEEVKVIKQTYDEKMKEYKDTQKMQEEYVGYMKNIDTLEKYRAYIQTSEYWADSWAISTLEVLLKIKMVIFSQEAYQERAFDNVLNCGDYSRSLEKSQTFQPKFYIMTSYDGSHYQLITYKKKKIFGFSEVPYDVKILIVNKCLEKNAGSYYMIQDFRNFKSRLGLDPEIGKPDESDEEDDDDVFPSHLYQRNTVFVFHAKSLNTSKPGKGSGEKIAASRQNEFLTLSKIKDWRKKLDDSWASTPFSVDGRRWASVDHYLQATKFKKGFPEMYRMFSLDQMSDLSRDVEMAKIVGDLSKSKYKDMRPKGIKVDVDYPLGRKDEERKTAIMAKFSQNEDLKQLLLSTKDAALKHTIRRKPAELDIALMEVRSKLREPMTPL